MSAHPRVVRREAVRLVLLDAEQHVLLHHYVTADTREEFWCTPGGALAANETHAEAAARELWEEEGIVLDTPPLRAPIWERLHVFTIGDGTRYEQHERYHVLHVPHFIPQPRGLSDFERESLVEQRWMRRHEVDLTPIALNPPELPRLLALALRSDT